MSSEIENECRLSYFKVIGTVNEKHNVYYVQNVEDKKIYVKRHFLYITRMFMNT